MYGCGLCTSVSLVTWCDSDLFCNLFNETSCTIYAVNSMVDSCKATYEYEALNNSTQKGLIDEVRSYATAFLSITLMLTFHIFSREIRRQQHCGQEVYCMTWQKT